MCLGVSIEACVILLAEISARLVILSSTDVCLPSIHFLAEVSANRFGFMSSRYSYFHFFQSRPKFRPASLFRYLLGILICHLLRSLRSGRYFGQLLSCLLIVRVVFPHPTHLAEILASFGLLLCVTNVPTVFWCVHRSLWHLAGRNFGQISHFFSVTDVCLQIIHFFGHSFG